MDSLKHQLRDFKTLRQKEIESQQRQAEMQRLEQELSSAMEQACCTLRCIVEC